MRTSFVSSARNFRNIRALTTAAALIALQIVVAQLTIVVSDALHITFDRCVLAVNASLLGPTVGMASGAIADLMQCLLHGWTPNPGLTLNEMLAGILYGLFLYSAGRPRPTGKKLARSVLLCQALAAVFLNMLLSTLWLSLWYHWDYIASLGPRVIKNLIQYPVDAAILWGLMLLRERLLSAGALKPFD